MLASKKLQLLPAALAIVSAVVYVLTAQITPQIDTRAADPPVVTSISPNVVSNTQWAVDDSLPPEGYTISGTGFTEATSASIGGVSCGAQLTVVSDTTIFCATSNVITNGSISAPVGPASVEVTTPDGTSTPNSLLTFAPPPTVQSISPSSGAIAGGTEVTIRGRGFLPYKAGFEQYGGIYNDGGSAVDFGAIGASGGNIDSCQNVQVVDDNTITCVTPFASGQSQIDTGYTYVSLYVQNYTTCGMVTWYARPTPNNNCLTFTYNPQTITGVSPSYGPVVGGNTMTISGTNFAPCTYNPDDGECEVYDGEYYNSIPMSYDVTIDGDECQIIAVTESQITCTVPPNSAGVRSGVATISYAQYGEGMEGIEYDAEYPFNYTYCALDDNQCGVDTSTPGGETPQVPVVPDAPDTGFGPTRKIWRANRLETFLNL